MKKFFKTSAWALGMEAAEPDTKNRPPRNSKEGIFAGGLFVDIAYQGVLVTVITIVELVKLIQRATVKK